MTTQPRLSIVMPVLDEAPQIAARIHPDNPRSGAVVERSGFQRAGELPDGTIVWVADQPPPL